MKFPISLNCKTITRRRGAPTGLYFQFPISNKGVTFIELLVIIGILLILVALSAAAFLFFQKESDLNNNAEEIINVLRLAQNKTLASEGASSYGVHFEGDKYVLFKGSSYDPLADDNEVHNLPSNIEIYQINLLGGGGEVIFDRILGTVSPSGKISLRLKTDSSKTKTVSIQSSGQVTLGEETSPSVYPLKDSRHVHFDYSRQITTSTEKIILIFTHDTSTTTQEVVIADNLKDGQIYWEGEVDVGGEIQKLKIHTHRLNNPDTQFCIHRDKRYNNKALTVTISGDGSGSLISYTAGGEESRGTSTFLAAGEAGDPQRQ